MNLIERLRKARERTMLVKPEEMQILEEAADELERKEALLAAEMESNHRLTAKELELSLRVERLEGALQQIVDEIPPNEHKKWHHHHHYLFVAREALSEDN